MSCTVRAATASEFPQVRTIIARAFKTDDEARLWDYLVKHDPSLVPAGVRVAEGEDGRIAACTVVLPRRVLARQGWVDGATITLVACDPDQQGKGYGGATVRDALAYMRAEGMCVGLLYGHPGYYPRFGFAPVLPAQLTTLPVAGVAQGEPLEPVTQADLPQVAALYAQHVAVYPGAMARTAEPWAWQPRTEGHALLTLPDRQGYAFASRMPEQGMLYVHEAAAADDDAARRLLRGLAGEARSHGLDTLKLNLPPDNGLVHQALTCGAEQVYREAGPGMAAVTDWAPLLPPGYTVADDADRTALIQLVMGYHSGEHFPPTFPKWSLEPFWS